MAEHLEDAPKVVYKHFDKKRQKKGNYDMEKEIVLCKKVYW